MASSLRVNSRTLTSKERQDFKKIATEFPADLREVLLTRVARWREFLQSPEAHQKTVRVKHRAQLLDEIWENPLWMDYEHPTKTPEKVKATVRLIFDNQTRYWKPEGIPTTSATTPHDDIPPSPPPPNAHDPKLCYQAMKKASGCWALFTSEMDDGRAFFVQKNRVEIDILRKVFVSRGDHAITAYEKALKESWALADQEDWHRHARALRDVNKNCQEFPRHALNTLNGLCQSKRLGDCEMMLLFSHRATNGRIVSTIVEGTSRPGRPSIVDAEPQAMQDFQAMWDSHVNEVMPRAAPNLEKAMRDEIYQIHHNIDGIPLFPSVHINNITMSELSTLVGWYLQELWDTTPGGYQAMIPWGAILVNPESFIDTEKYQLPTYNLDPSILDITSMFELGAFFLAESASKPEDPFHFLSQETAGFRGSVAPEESDRHSNSGDLDNSSCSGGMAVASPIPEAIGNKCARMGGDAGPLPAPKATPQLQGKKQVKKAQQEGDGKLPTAERVTRSVTRKGAGIQGGSKGRGGAGRGLPPKEGKKGRRGNPF